MAFDWRLDATVAGVCRLVVGYRGDVQSQSKSLRRSAAVEARLFRLCDLLMMF